MAKKKEEGEKGYFVIAPFRSKDNFRQTHEIGEDVSSFEESRLAELVELGLVQYVEPKGE